MNKLLQHVRLLPGRVLVRRPGNGYWYGEIVAGGPLGMRVIFERVEATFQKGKSHYAVVLSRNMQREPRGSIILQAEKWVSDAHM